MKFWIFFILIILLASGCIRKMSECDVLAKNFDEKINHVDAQLCWGSPEEEWIGGTLVNVSKNHHPLGFYTYKLYFIGKEKGEYISIQTNKKDFPYEVGKFYKFDINKKCDLLFSAAMSGQFPDPYLNELEPLDCD